MKELKGSIRFSRIYTNRGDDYVSFEVEDSLSGIHFLHINLSMENFGKLMSSASFVDVDMEVRGLQNVGKKYESKRGSITISNEEYSRIVDGTRYSEGKKVLGEWLKENAKLDGWHINTYLGSQDSVVGSGDKKTLNFTYFRFVDEENSQS